MTERRHIQERLLQAERLQTAGRIASQVAHDFNNLLAPMLGFPELIKEQLPPGHPAIEWCQIMMQAAEQAARINDDLLALGRRGHIDREPCDVNVLVTRAMAQFLPFAPLVTTDLDLAADLPIVRGVPGQLVRLIANLVVNGVEAMQDAGTLTVRTEHVYVDRPHGRLTPIPVGEYVRLEVRDTGAGITPEMEGRIFDAFFTTKQADRQRGTGLGLSVVHAVVEDHDGYLDLASAPGETTFSVYLPTSQDNESARSSIPPEAMRGVESVLLIDDDPFQRAVGQELLSSLGYDVQVVASGEEAVMLAADRRFDILVLDMVMPPGIDGAETYTQIQELWPGQRAVLVSGFAESERVRAAQQLGAGAFLRKPVARDRLSAAVRAELDHR